MSEENTTDTVVNERKAREPKKNSIARDKVNDLISGIPSYEKTSFLVVGHRDGIRLAIPKTSGVSRAYFYGNGDYTLVPTHDAITVFSEEQRKEQRRGGIMAEIDFDKGLETATEAFELLVNVVKAANAPVPKAVKVKKAAAAPKAKKVSADDDAEPVVLDSDVAESKGQPEA